MSGIKYVSFQIDNEFLEDHQMKRGWVVRGQRAGTLNWEQITGELCSREGAVETMRNIFAIQGYTRAVMYDEYGYGIDE